MGERNAMKMPGAAWLCAVVLGLGSLALFCYNIGFPATPYFDETHYVPAARALLARSGPVNIEHPLLAKTVIAAGMLIFGDNSFGWRLPSALLAAVAVAAFFWIALMLLRDLRAAVLTALLLVFNQTHFIQARIAMLEMPMTVCILLGLGCFIRARQGGPTKRMQWELGGAIALGLAVGAKWLAIPYAILFLGWSAWEKWKDSGSEKAMLLDDILPDTMKLIMVSALTYFVTFWPAFFYLNQPMTLGNMLGFQIEMFNVQRGHMSPHPYQSVWWQWPLMLRPIWYLFERFGNSYRAVLLVGNPVIYWGGLASIAALATRWMGKTPVALKYALGLYTFSLAIWIVIPKEVEFSYYYNLSAIWLCLVLGAFFMSFGERGRRWLGWFTFAAGGMFLYFYPVISAQPLPIDDSWTNWVWMKSWY